MILIFFKSEITPFHTYVSGSKPIETAFHMTGSKPIETAILTF
jgi:hypothetical protein